MRLPRLPRGEAGVVLVHVLIMAVLLIILATGVMKIVFSNHVLIAHVKTSDQYRYWVEACQARVAATWDSATRCSAALDASCAGCTNSINSQNCCDFTAQNGPCVAVTCDTGSQVNYRVTW